MALKADSLTSPLTVTVSVRHLLFVKGCLSVVIQYCIKTAYNIVEIRSLPDMPNILVFWYCVTKFRWDHPLEIA